MKETAKVLSWLFLPLFAPVFALMLGMFVEAQQPDMFLDKSLYYLKPDAKYFFIYVFAAFSAVFPILTLVYFKLTGIISSLQLHSREERMMPAFAVNLAAIGMFILLLSIDKYGNFPQPIYALSLGSAITVAVTTIITAYWKISLHAAGMGIITGFAFAYFAGMQLQAFWVLPLILVVSGTVISARMYLEAHSLEQSLSGFFIGVAATVATVLLY